MFRSFSFGAAFATILAMAAAPASAQVTVLSQGENFAVQRDAADAGNIVGGGAVEVASQGEDIRIRHRDPAYAERAPGIPFQVGGGNGDVVYLQPGNASSLLAAMPGSSPG
jgi:alpha/beta superfamily hydrolase